MSRHLFGSTLAGVFALTIGMAAQTYPPKPQPQSPTSSPTTQEQTATVTVEGCLMREQDVPGRKPNVVERAGVMEDYILTHTKMVKGTAPAANTAQPRPDEATGTSGSPSRMYDVKGIDGDRLKPLAGKRVEIDGTFADVTRSPSAAPTEDLVDIRGTAIRQVSGECPPK
jgi:hypothetical protein